MNDLHTRTYSFSADIIPSWVINDDELETIITEWSKEI